MILRMSGTLACAASLFTSACSPISISTTDAFSQLSWPPWKTAEKSPDLPPAVEVAAFHPATPEVEATTRPAQKPQVRLVRPSRRVTAIPVAEKPEALEEVRAVAVDPTTVIFSCRPPDQSGQRVSVECHAVEQH